MWNHERQSMLMLGVALTTLLHCTDAARGPTFVWAEAAPAHRARIYIYRTDPRPSLASVKISIDGNEIGSFQNREYETLELAAGRHRLKAGMRGLGFIRLGWNEHDFRVKPGETVYLHVAVRLDSAQSPTAAPTPRELEIGGRAGPQSAENVFVGRQSRQAAEPDLEVSTRLPHPE